MKGIKFEDVILKAATTHAVTGINGWTVTGLGACATLVKGGAA